MSVSKFRATDKAYAELTARPVMKSGITIGGIYTVECFDADGNLKWRECDHNIFTTVGVNEMLDVVFGSDSAATNIFVGLKDVGAVLAGDDMTTQTNWDEAVPYSESVRQTWTPNGAAAAGAVSNSSAKATFSINATDDVDGAFLCDDDTKGGSSGILFSAIDFAATRSVADGDTLTVQYDLTCADDGV